MTPRLPRPDRCPGGQTPAVRFSSVLRADGRRTQLGWCAACGTWVALMSTGVRLYAHARTPRNVGKRRQRCPS